MSLYSLSVCVCVCVCVSVYLFVLYYPKAGPNDVSKAFGFVTGDKNMLQLPEEDMRYISLRLYLPTTLFVCFGCLQRVMT